MSRSRSARAPARPARRSPLFQPEVLAWAVAAAFTAAPRLAHANPAGGVPVHGQATFTNPQPNRLVVTTQNGAGTRHSAIDWQSFSIPQGSSTFFQQPDAASTSINRVLGNNPSAIFGTLGSNGRLVLVNPAGIAVGAGAVVDTAGFTASTLRMSDADAIAGRLRFGDGSAAMGGAGGITVQGNILARGGDLVLIAPSVQTAGEALLQAPNGSTILAAGRKVEITGRGLEGIRMEVQAPADQAVNLGTLQGDAVAVFAGTLKHSGAIEARAVSVEGGKVVLKAAEQAEISGSTRAQRLENLGGLFQATANKVMLRSGAIIDVSGPSGGGEALIGGGWQGKDARVANAQQTTVEKGVSINADATMAGDGGTVVAWSDGSTWFGGSISARGGELAGNGGMAETSGKQLTFRGQADLSAKHGRAGTLLLDPAVLTIKGGSPDSSLDTVFETDLEALNANVVLQAVDTVKATGTFANNDLAVQPGYNLSIETTATGPSGGSEDGIRLTGANVKLKTSGMGTIELKTTASSAAIETNALETAGGHILVDAGGNVSLGGASVVNPSAVSSISVASQMGSTIQLGGSGLAASQVTVQAVTGSIVADPAAVVDLTQSGSYMGLYPVMLEARDSIGTSAHPVTIKRRATDGSVSAESTSAFMGETIALRILQPATAPAPAGTYEAVKLSQLSVSMNGTGTAEVSAAGDIEVDANNIGAGNLAKIKLQAGVTPAPAPVGDVRVDVSTMLGAGATGQIELSGRDIVIEGSVEARNLLQATASRSLSVGVAGRLTATAPGAGMALSGATLGLNGSSIVQVNDGTIDFQADKLSADGLGGTVDAGLGYVLIAPRGSSPRAVSVGPAPAPGAPLVLSASQLEAMSMRQLQLGSGNTTGVTINAPLALGTRNLLLVTGSGNIVDTAASHISARMVAVQAQGTTSSVNLSNSSSGHQVNRLAGETAGSGGISFKNATDLQLDTLTSSDGVTYTGLTANAFSLASAGGTIRLQVGGTLAVDQAVNANGGTVVLSTTGATSDLNVDASVMGGRTGVGGVTLTAGRNLVLHTGMSVPNFLSLNAGTDIVLDKAGAIYTAGNGAISVNSAAPAPAPGASRIQVLQDSTLGSVSATQAVLDLTSGADITFQGNASFHTMDIGTVAAHVTLAPAPSPRTINLGDAFNVAAWGKLVLSGAGTVKAASVDNHGVLDLAANTGVSSSGAFVNQADGVLTGSGKFSATGLLGKVDNYGTIAPGAVGTVGTLSIGGNLMLQSDSQLLFDLQSPSSYDRIAVSGTLMPGGLLSTPITVDVTPLGGFVTVSPTNFNLVTASLSTLLLADLSLQGTAPVGSNLQAQTSRMVLAVPATAPAPTPTPTPPAPAPTPTPPAPSPTPTPPAPSPTPTPPAPSPTPTPPAPAPTPTPPAPAPVPTPPAPAPVPTPPAPAPTPTPPAPAPVPTPPAPAPVPTPPAPAPVPTPPAPAPVPTPPAPAPTPTPPAPAPVPTPPAPAPVPTPPAPAPVPTPPAPAPVPTPPAPAPVPTPPAPAPVPTPPAPAPVPTPPAPAPAPIPPAPPPARSETPTNFVETFIAKFDEEVERQRERTDRPQTPDPLQVQGTTRSRENIVAETEICPR